MCSRAWQDLELQSRRRYTVSSAVFSFVFFESDLTRSYRSPKFIGNFAQNNRVKALISKTRVKALVQKKIKKSIDLSLQLCFVKWAVYPVIGRGGRQVRPRLIFKVNCKRVNMFQKFIKQFVNVVFFFGPRKVIFFVGPYESREIMIQDRSVVVDNQSLRYIAVQICE